MARTVKCKICGKSVDINSAYKVIHVTKSNKTQNQYFCSQLEYEERKKEKEYYKECQYLLDDIFGEVIVDNTRNKKLSELHKAGYTYETIYNCINDISNKIENALVIKRTDFEGKNSMYLKLSYCFGIIKKEIVNYEHKGKEKKINSDTLNIYEVTYSKRKVKQEKRGLIDIIRGDVGGK